MPRPRKQGLSYFAHQVTGRIDPLIDHLAPQFGFPLAYTTVYLLREAMAASPDGWIDTDAPATWHIFKTFLKQKRFILIMKAVHSANVWQTQNSHLADPEMLGRRAKLEEDRARDRKRKESEEYSAGKPQPVQPGFPPENKKFSVPFPPDTKTNTKTKRAGAPNDLLPPNDLGTPLPEKPASLAVVAYPKTNKGNTYKPNGNGNGHARPLASTVAAVVAKFKPTTATEEENELF